MILILIIEELAESCPFWWISVGPKCQENVHESGPREDCALGQQQQTGRDRNMAGEKAGPIEYQFDWQYFSCQWSSMSKLLG